MNPLDYLNSKAKKKNNYYLRGWVDQFTGGYGGGSFGQGGFGGFGGGSYMSSSTGIGGRTSQDIRASGQYQDLQAQQAESDYRALMDRIQTYNKVMQQSGFEPTSAYANQQAQQYLQPQGFVFGPKAELQTLGTGVKASELRKLGAQAKKAELKATPRKIELELQAAETNEQVRQERIKAIQAKIKNDTTKTEAKAAAQQALKEGKEAQAENILNYSDMVNQMSQEAQAIAYDAKFFNAIKNGADINSVASSVEALANAKIALAQSKMDADEARRKAAIDLEDYRRGRASEEYLQKKLSAAAEMLARAQAYVAALGDKATPQEHATVAAWQATVNSYIGQIGTQRTEATGGVASPTTQAEFDALPSGAMYRDPDDGNLYRKP